MSFQEIDYRRILAKTKWVEQIDRLTACPSFVARAFQVDQGVRAGGVGNERRHAARKADVSEALCISRIGAPARCRCAFGAAGRASGR